MTLRSGEQLSKGPQKIYRLRYVVPEVEADEPDTGYQGGDPVLDENGDTEWSYERVRYYMRKSSLNRRLKQLERWSDHMELGWEPMVAARVLSIEEATVDWNPEGKEKVNGPIFCAVCKEPTGKGDFQYDLTDKRGNKLYAFTHSKNCDAKFKRTLSNPEVPLERAS